jgi:hypothetical protein
MSPTVPPTSPISTSQPSAAARMPSFDLVGDVRDHLHRAAEVVAATFARDHRVVHLAGGEVVLLAHAHRQEALVVTEIEDRSRRRRR